jgi:hypothetical protein
MDKFRNVDISQTQWLNISLATLLILAVTYRIAYKVVWIDNYMKREMNFRYGYKRITFLLRGRVLRPSNIKFLIHSAVFIVINIE